MDRTWAVSGIDLHVEVAGTRVSRSLEDALRRAVASGGIPGGTRLPATRTLAADLGVSRNSVARAYEQLTAEGWLDARVGAGTWVSDRVARPVAPPPSPVPTGPVLDLRGGVPDPTAFPRQEWASAVRRAVSGAPADVFGYTDPRGVPALREALAEYLARARGVRASGENVFVGRGFADVLAVVCGALRARGARRFAVEEYGHGAHRRIIRAHGLEVLALPVDEGGADVSLLDGSGAEAVLLTPAHQFPTGVPLAADRRVRLVRWAERTGALVVEDDYDGEFRYDRRAVGALQALAPEHVLYAGTASKSLAPAVGLAWAAAPPSLVPAMVARRESTGGGQDTLNQLALAEFVGSHQYDRNVRRLRHHYCARREALDTAVRERLPGCRVSGLSAGLHCLVELPEGTRESDVAAEAARRGLALEGLSSFAAAPGRVDRVPGRRPSVVVGYGAPRSHQYARALAAAVAAVSAVAAPR
ncbi:PLP-dependent aminotransferase family protein [Nocardiopsis sp. CNS-639]|uniref:MocR-like pyridoxine biosynthesis transcription factor PdxR n=1 Tax=Nocardiopsis sp. CNS-639 TaxID=1169153 RepID=UPI0003A0A7BD|nr:PLP-dependent aminotransferase family protein [Nocardiopsis sp. CNS-639]